MTTTTPTTASLEVLPYISALSPALQQQSDGKKAKLLPVALLETLLEEYNVCREVRGTRDATKHTKSIRESCIESASKAISRQYRKASILVHPDRYGTLYESEFDLLKQAYETLQDSHTRHDYMEKMLDVISLTGHTNKEWIQKAHTTWVQDHHKNQERETDRARYARAFGNAPAAENLYLDGGIMIRKPKAIIVQSFSDKSRQAQLWLPLIRPFQEFRSCCTAIMIYTEDDDGNKLLLKKLTGSPLGKAFEGGAAFEAIRAHVQFPSHGIWTVFWKACLEDIILDRKIVETPESSPIEIDMTDPVIRRLLNEKPILLELAKQLSGELRASVQRLLSHQDMNRQELESRYWDLHRVVCKAQTLATRLKHALQTLEEDEEMCRPLTSLIQTLGQARLAKSKLDDTINAAEKKDTLKAFKNSVAAMMERGEAALWISTVTEKDIVNHGGESNRLFQLFIEGKKANSILVDSATLGNAAGRSDLFSSKQCETLAKRRDEMETETTAETARLIKEAKERELLEKTRLEMKKRGQFMARGSIVKIHGLKKRLELNGSLGIYMGLAEGAGRFLVRPHSSNVEVSLLATNFEKWADDGTNGSASTTDEGKNTSTTTVVANAESWLCTKCTFLNKDCYANSMRCHICETPRGPSEGSLASTAISTSAHRSGAPVVSRASNATNTKAQQSQLPVVLSAENQTPKPRSKIKSTVYIRAVDASRFIGTKGRNVKYLLGQTGANRITVDQEDSSRKGMFPVNIEGSSEAVQRAVSAVNAFVRKQEQKSPDGISVSSTFSNASPLPFGSNASLSPGSLKSKQSATNSSSKKAPAPAVAGKTQKPVVFASTPAAAATNTNAAPAPSQLAGTNSSATTKPEFGTFATASSSAAGSFVFGTANALTDNSGAKVTSTAPAPSFFGNTKPEEASTLAPSFGADTGATPDRCLLGFLQRQQVCLKGSPEAFHEWLQSEDIYNLNDLAEAVDDDDFVRSDMQQAGLKGFKRAAFKKEIQAAVGAATVTKRTKLKVPPPTIAKEPTSIPNELLCPIEQVVMVNDPVVARDGHTYERTAIESWFETARNMNAGAVRSPITNEVLIDLTIFPNIQIRNMARDYARNNL
jgi:hypothetical protein